MKSEILQWFYEPPKGWEIVSRRTCSSYDNFLCKKDVANRIKIIYLYGYDTIPEDIKRLNVLLAKRILIRDNVGKSLIEGRDEFRPEMYNIDEDEIKSIVRIGVKPYIISAVYDHPYRERPVNHKLPQRSGHSL